jgi:hypothetical protein
MEGEERQLKKKTRIKQQEKKKFSKTSGTLAGQMSRAKSAKGYTKTAKKKVKIKF